MHRVCRVPVRTELCVVTFAQGRAQSEVYAACGYGATGAFLHSCAARGELGIRCLLNNCKACV